MTALYIKANGEKRAIIPANRQYFSLFELNRLIGGPIQLQLSKNKKTIISIDEQFIPNNGLDVNVLASELLNKNKIVKGNIIVCDWEK